MFGIRIADCFFGTKIHRGGMNATDMYLTEILRAALNEKLKTEVYLTQVRIKSGELSGHSTEYIKESRPYANAIMWAQVDAYFTSLDYPTPHGREGILPAYPHVVANFTLTSDTAGFYSWEVFDIALYFENYPEPLPESNRFFFEEYVEPPSSKPSDQLRKLARELCQRGPARFHKDE